ncbi:MAG: chemotaxis protein CheW [Bacteroidales bacterium]
MATGEALRQAFAGREQLVADMLAQRSRELARLSPEEGAASQGIQVLRLSGVSGVWALPVAAVARVEVLPVWVPLPMAPPAVLGLALVAGRRCLLADADTVLGAVPPRPPGRPGHVVVLRPGHGGQPMALAIDRAEAVIWLPPPRPGCRVLADGSLLVDPNRLAGVIAGGGAP